MMISKEKDCVKEGKRIFSNRQKVGILLAVILIISILICIGILAFR